jgi:hypothetical protein
MFTFLKRSRQSVPDGTDPLKIRDLMESSQLQAVMGPQYLIGTHGQGRLVLRRAAPRSFFGIDVRPVERVR